MLFMPYRHQLKYGVWAFPAKVMRCIVNGQVKLALLLYDKL